MRKITVSLLLLLPVFIATAQTISIIPQPVSLKQPKIAASFIVTPATQIVLEGSNMTNAVEFFNNYLQRFFLFKLKVVKNSASKNAIRLNFERLDSDVAGAYHLKVDGNGVYIAGDNENGVFYGIQTLIQLLPVPDAGVKMKMAKLVVPYVSIEDAPRFAYRGLHLDVGRHFMPVDFVKKYIDYIALHKMNYFHWHLTEDQGWRIEIKKYPRLTEVGGWRNGTITGRYPGNGNDGIKYGGFYTQEQIKEIVKYAAARYITVIPEIEMPGHSSAAIAAYPQLSCFPDQQTGYPKACAWSGPAEGKQVQQTWGVFDDVFCAGKESTFEFLEGVMDEVLTLFPSKYIHVGGDECPKAHWKKCPLCQQRMKENNLKDEHELQSYFIQRMEKYLNKKGRSLIGWDEILEGGLAPNAVVMSWRGEKGGIDAAKENHDVIMTPGNPVYFDHSQSDNEDSVTIGGYNPIEKVYAYEPIPKELNADQAKHILGAQANMWTEYMKNTNKVEYMLFPRISALSEVLWSPKEKKDWKDFEKRLEQQFKRYDLWKTNYSRAYFNVKTTVIPGTLSTSYLLWRIEIKDKKKLIGVAETNPAWNTEKDVPVEGTPKESSDYIITHTGAFVAKSTGSNGEIIKLTQNFWFNKATGKKITLAAPADSKYPGDGPFTLVNGVQNEKGLARTKEILGFNGTDCEATIDLGSFGKVDSVTVHIFQQPSSWIWKPLSVEALISDDGQYFSSLGKTDKLVIKNGGNGTMTVKGSNTGRVIKIIIKNGGVIPEGNPGAGNKAWLFVDEIEVN
ncbi:MAG: beta-N-acetylhexosaminidase [Chitinophagaceae bacterium]